MKSTREELQQAVIDAVLKLVQATGTAAFCAPLPGMTPPLYLALGEPYQIIALLQDEAANDAGMRH